MLFRTDEERLSLADAGRPWAFDVSGEEFKLAVEAYRINLAHLFDPMMAVHTSNVEPLPHQITAVYEAMLPCQPLRFVLADDPGAGKTIMAGLLVRELLMRADTKRVLVVAPGSLVEQWQDELWEKFGLRFEIFSGLSAPVPAGTNPFDKSDLWLCRLDQLSRNEDYQALLKATDWDIAIVDEAHKCSAHWIGAKVDKTKRFRLIEDVIGPKVRHLLLMTATPHNGKDEDFQLFLSLLDSDRFYGKFRDGAHKVDVTDLMRRMVKEQLVKFDGTPLFPERRAYTVNYKLSEMEAALYESVTNYVREEMNRADRLEDGKRRGTVGFALTALQRRLASSPEAIYQSLRRRRAKLKRRVEDEKLRSRGLAVLDVGVLNDAPEDLNEAADEMPDEEYEQMEEEVVDQATAAQTIQELEAEINILEGLEEQAREVLHSGLDRKWDELSSLLQNTPEMRDENGRQRKLIIFSEHRDTLNYLVNKIRGLLGSDSTVVSIHGGVKREERRKLQELFRNDVDTRILVATDAAGEGVNLQNANLMVNYDLPWNPNRLEQRFGRIHRIGQTEVCHLWNIVASETREGYVFERLLEKIETIRKALGGRVYDVLGEVFEDRPLRELLIEAIRYGNDPEVKKRLSRVMEGALNTEHLKEIMDRNALAEEVMSAERVFAVKEEMEKAEARKLQPYFVRSFFTQAFQALKGDLRSREPGRYEITHVPASIRERDRLLAGRDRRYNDPVVRRYERVCFEKQFVRHANKPMATLIHPAHPLMQSITDIVLEQHRDKLKRGTILLDPNDLTTQPRLLFLIDHSVKEGTPGSQAIASRRIQFVEATPNGVTLNAGWAPHLDLQPLGSEERSEIEDLLKSDWLTPELEQRALAHASTHLVPEHFTEVRDRRERFVNKTLQAVHERLIKEINFWSDRYIKTQDDVAANKQPRVNLDNIQRTIDDLQARLESRRKELENLRNVVSTTPIIVGGALVIPQGLLNQRKGKGEVIADPAAKTIVEMMAMKAVMDAERALGHQVIDVSGQKCGWDVTALPPTKDGKIPDARHIEVKGRAKGSSTVTVTRNEVLYGLNQSDKFILAVVFVDGNATDEPHYIRHPFTQEPDWAVTSINLDLDALIAKAQSPHATI
ncbi:MAG TPA: helicase-related protein [Ktedonobacteraceae bacterium]|nr:helicase-related protein [Ktedonobacteraceae bacterium]